MTYPNAPHYPTSALVVCAWIAENVPGVTAAMVATALPRDPQAWASTGFVQVTIVPGAADVDGLVRNVYAQVDCWAATLDAAGTVSQKRPVHRANGLAEAIRVATEERSAQYGRPVTLPAGYSGARVLSWYTTTEPNSVPDDPSGYARVTFDLVLTWARS